MARTLPPYKFCPLCGSALRTREIGHRERQACPACPFVYWQNPVPGVAVVAFERDRVVLVRTAQPGYLHGQWCFPCGHVEYDEHLRDAAAREFEEETGLTVKVGDVYHVDSNFFEPWGVNSVGVWFEGRITGGTLSPGGDVMEAGTFPLNGLPKKIAYKSDMRVLRKLCHERGYPEPDIS